MNGKAIKNLNIGLKTLETELKNDDVASMRVQLLLISIGGHSDTEILTELTDAIDFIAPTIIANGTTPLGKGVNLGLKKLEEQKKRYLAKDLII